jgi:hypothetical protein
MARPASLDQETTPGRIHSPRSSSAQFAAQRAKAELNAAGSEDAGSPAKH